MGRERVSFITHTHTHTHAHTNKKGNEHTNNSYWTYACMSACIHTHTHACTPTRGHTLTYTLQHSHPPMYVHSQTCTQAHTCIHTHAHAHKYPSRHLTDMHGRADATKGIHICTQAHTCTWELMNIKSSSRDGRKRRKYARGAYEDDNNSTSLLDVCPITICPQPRLAR
jgi:hypothetical protein